MSTLKADTIQNTSGGAVTLTNQHAAKAWINFNGASTGAVGDYARESFNCAVVTDHGTGDYTVAMSSAMATTSYSFLGTASQATTGNNGQIVSILASTAPTTTEVRFRTQQDGIGVTNSQYVCLAVHGDLA